MVSFPIPAMDGSNAPVDVLVIPDPDHVPPLVAAVNVIGAALTQSEVGPVIEGSALGVMVINAVSEFPHVPLIV